jgi:hypothetical protein
VSFHPTFFSIKLSWSKRLAFRRYGDVVEEQRMSISTIYRLKQIGVALAVMVPVILLGVAFAHAFGIHLWVLNGKGAPGGSQDTPISIAISFLMATIGFGFYVSSEWAKRNPPPER